MPEAGTEGGICKEITIMVLRGLVHNLKIMVEVKSTECLLHMYYFSGCDWI